MESFDVANGDGGRKHIQSVRGKLPVHGIVATGVMVDSISRVEGFKGYDDTDIERLM